MWSFWLSWSTRHFCTSARSRIPERWFFLHDFFLSFLSLPLQLPIAQQIFWLIHNSLSPHVFTPGWSLISRLSLQHTQILPPGCLPSSFLFLGRRWDFQGIFHPPHNFSPSGKSMSTRERILDKKKTLHTANFVYGLSFVWIFYNFTRRNLLERTTYR